MKLSKETEQEIRQIYQIYWDAYLSGDFETFASFLDDHIVIYGTAVGEIFSTKEEALAFYTATAEEMTGKAEFRNREISIQPVGDTIVIYEQSQLYILIEGTWTYYGFARITGIFEKKGNEWKLVHQHGSFPDSRTEEGQQIASEKIKEENLQLREAVQRRTVELENKTRELEIESSLERVRTVAMGMRKPDDMLAVCEVIAGQLQSLGINGIRNVQTAIIDDDGKETYMNYQYFAQYREGTIEHVDSARHPKVKDMITQMQASPDAFFSHSFDGAALEEWKQYRRDDHQFPDPILEESTAVHFYFYSIGQGGLGISAYTALTESNIAVFHRFRNVFALAYQRFRDIEQAEAQTREAQIELAMERVRARTMAMQHSDELSELVKLLYEEFDKLKMSNESTDIEIGLIDEATGIASVWAHFYLSDGTISTFKFPFAHFEETNREFQEWKATPPEKRIQLFFTTEIKGERWQHFVSRADEVPELAEIFRPLLEAKITKWVTHNAYFSHGILTLQGTEVYSGETLDIQKRFAKVFEQTYTRFLDLQKAEEQTREAQIEAALERIRSRTMAMQKSDELKDVIQVVYDQFVLLKINIEHTGFIIDYKVRNDMHIWLADIYVSPFQITIPYFDSPHWNSFVEAKDKGKDFFSNLLNFEEKNKFYADLFKLIPGLPEESQQAIFSKPGLAISTVLLDNVGLYIENFSGIPYTDEENVTLMRFGTVFQQTYTRFLDLQKAEAQAREAQIEAALERVRSRTMAMQKSEELSETAQVLFKQFIELGENPIQITIGIIHEKEKVIEFNVTDWAGGGSKVSKSFMVSISEPTLVNKLHTAWRQKEKSLVIDLKGRELEDWLTYRKAISGIDVKSGDTRGRRVITSAFFSKGHVSFSSPEPRPAESIKLLERFASVFDLTYTRFLDLQHAEAQVREAQIEAALEKVRSRSLAMQKSDELNEVIAIVFEKLKGLDIRFTAVGIGILIDGSKDFNSFICGENEAGLVLTNYRLPYFDHKIPNDINHAFEKQLDFFVGEYSKEEKDSFYEYVIEHTAEFRYLPEDIKRMIFESPSYSISMVAVKHAVFNINDFEGNTLSANDIDIIKRFARVFEQAYTRFLDLQKAEARSREAQIEASLDRVRAHAMGLRKSEELENIISVIFEELQKLGLELYECSIFLRNGTTREFTVWAKGNSDEAFLTHYQFLFVDHPILNEVIRDLGNNVPFRAFSLDELEIKSYANLIFSQTDLKDASAEYKESFSALQRVFVGQALFKYGLLEAVGTEPLPGDLPDVLQRFTQVIELTYTRFLDLQNAESQTHKVKIEVALERVRARALAMQEPEELIEVAQVMRHEMGLLGIEELETSSIYIHDEGSDIADCWYAIKDIRVPEKKLVADHITIELHKSWVGREMLKFYNSSHQQASIIMQGTNRIEWINYCSGISDVLEDFYGEVIPDRTYHLYKFSNGAIGAAAEGDISEESWELLRRATSVFSLAYSRFKDLTQARMDLQKLKTEKQRAEDALAHLKDAQTQLIQSEKMASLGELTAGIAHEIQNPLNFVNNFSDLNTELIEEMKHELQSGNTGEAIALADDIAENEQKINHHGKRADAIVKGMLQHSRSTSGVKEPTDINALADEYLRLAYHGLRAKDNSFNATMKTDFDPAIGLVNIIPQDIGRVILNLITNAFYAVSNKTPYLLKGGPDYQPTVTITTKHQHPLSGGRGSKESGDQGANRGSWVEISVSDNGPGIPQHILDKIFQPFFTTKPTGQGTGLGLSLSYDIVKAHGGELTVETKEGEGSVFIIQLPVS